MQKFIPGIGVIAFFVIVGILVWQLSGAGRPAAQPVPPARFPSQWLESLPEAQAIAQKEDKLILADFQGSDWCHWCIKFREEIADTQPFQAWAADNVVLLNVDFPRAAPQSEAQQQANAGLAETYGVLGFPTILLLRPDGAVVARLGYSHGGPAVWLAEVQPHVTQFAAENNAPVTPAPSAGK